MHLADLARPGLAAKTVPHNHTDPRNTVSDSQALCGGIPHPSETRMLQEESSGPSLFSGTRDIPHGLLRSLLSEGGIPGEICC